jgi:SAM-dependent methyltransferase
LELAAGPARHSITALKSFSQVATCTALDLSHDMMEYALGLAEDEVHNKSFTYVLDDMRYMTSIAPTIANEPFDAVWLLCWSIQHLLTHEDALHCFQSTYRLLNPGGLFILQIAPPAGLYTTGARNEIPLYDQHGNDCGLLTLVNGQEDDEIDDILQICNMTWSIEWNDFEKHTNVINRDMRRSSESAEGEDIQEEASRGLKEIVPCRYFTLQEIYALAKLSGFEVVGTFGELDEDVDIHVESATRHMVCVLRKQVTS